MKSDATTIILCVSMTLLLLTSGCRNRNDQGANREAGPVMTSIFAYGTVEARKHSTLSAKFPGKIEKILVDEGQRVKKDQVLALFEAKELTARVETARAGLAVARARLAEAEAGTRSREIARAREHLNETEAILEKAGRDRDRARKLYADKLIPESEWEAARLHHDRALAARNEASLALALLEEGVRKETIAVLRREVELAAAGLRLAETTLENARLTAPFDGVVTRKHREEGEAMDIGLPVMDIATLDDRYVRAEIDETDIGRLRLDQEAVITADGFPGLEFRGRVAAIKKQMGPKLLIPTDPSKIIDYKVLDIEITLPKDCPFPIKLPVNVRISL